MPRSYLLPKSSRAEIVYPSTTKNMGAYCRRKNVSKPPPPPPKDTKDDEKKGKAAPAGSWLLHEDKDTKNNGILW